VRDLSHRFGKHVLCNAAAFQGFREPSRSPLIKLCFITARAFADTIRIPTHWHKFIAHGVRA
jgi:hypothetical protein